MALGQDDHWDAVLKEEENKVIRRRLQSILTDDEYYVIAHYYGLGNFDYHRTYQDIADTTGI